MTITDAAWTANLPWSSKLQHPWPCCTLLWKLKFIGAEKIHTHNNNQIIASILNHSRICWWGCNIFENLNRDGGVNAILNHKSQYCGGRVYSVHITVYTYHGLLQGHNIQQSANYQLFYPSFMWWLEKGLWDCCLFENPKWMVGIRNIHGNISVGEWKCITWQSTVSPFRAWVECIRMHEKISHVNKQIR